MTTGERTDEEVQVIFAIQDYVRAFARKRLSVVLGEGLSYRLAIAAIDYRSVPQVAVEAAKYDAATPTGHVLVAGLWRHITSDEAETLALVAVDFLIVQD